MIVSTTSLTDPDGAGAVTAAATWVRALVIGTPATILATIAVAAVGFLMLAGRLPMRRAGTVLLGCFIIFGAGHIATALVGLVTVNSGTTSAASVEAAPPAQVTAPAQPEVYDPYAGASVPVR